MPSCVHSRPLNERTPSDLFKAAALRFAECFVSRVPTVRAFFALTLTRLLLLFLPCMGIRMKNKHPSTVYNFTFDAVGNKALLPKARESQMDVVPPFLCDTRFQDIGAQSVIGESPPSPRWHGQSHHVVRDQPLRCIASISKPYTPFFLGDSMCLQ